MGFGHKSVAPNKGAQRDEEQRNEPKDNEAIAVGELSAGTLNKSQLCEDEDSGSKSAQESESYADSEMSCDLTNCSDSESNNSSEDAPYPEIPLGATYADFRQSYADCYLKRTKKRVLLWRYFTKNLDYFKLFGLLLVLTCMSVFIVYIVLQTKEYIKGDTTTTTSYSVQTETIIPSISICKATQQEQWRQGNAHLMGMNFMSVLNRTMSCAVGSNSEPVSCGNVVYFYHPWPSTSVNYCVLINSALVNPNPLMFQSPSDQLSIRLFMEDPIFEDGQGLLVNVHAPNTVFMFPRNSYILPLGTFLKVGVARKESKRITNCQKGSYNRLECLFESEKQCIRQRCNCTYVVDLLETAALGTDEALGIQFQFAWPSPGTSSFAQLALVNRAWERAGMPNNSSLTVDVMKKEIVEAEKDFLAKGFLYKFILPDSFLASLVTNITSVPSICDKLTMTGSSSCFKGCDRTEACSFENCDTIEYESHWNEFPITQEAEKLKLMPPGVNVTKVVAIEIFQYESITETSEEIVQYPFLSYIGEVSGMFGFLLGASLMNIIYFVSNFPQILERAREFDTAKAFEAQNKGSHHNSMDFQDATLDILVQEPTMDESGEQGESTSGKDGNISVNISEELPEEVESSGEKVSPKNHNLLTVN
eukprot:Nk52_evm20s252 gene=Nk52_evmTU20s252